MNDQILVLDAGSSSLKFALYATAGDVAPSAAAVRGQVEAIGIEPRLTATDAGGKRLVDKPLPPQPEGPDGGLAHVLAWLEPQPGGLDGLAAVGHRIVHGGAALREPTRITPGVLAQLEALVPLAPLHQPNGIAGIRAVSARLPGVLQVACFDTAFHAAQPEVASRFGLPREMHAQGLRRYGFHGLSYQSIAGRLPQVLGPASDGRVIVAHLGNGASLCALRGRRSVATTMGFTALDGLLMGTRCGSLDPGAVLYLLESRTREQVAELLYQRSGLLGVSGLSSDMRTLLASREPAAAEAVDLFVYRIARELGSLAAALGGLQALVFTAGIGEHSAPVRARVCDAARWLGVLLDPKANAAHGPRISAPESPVSAWVIPTDEEQVIAHAVFAQLQHDRVNGVDVAR